MSGQMQQFRVVGVKNGSGEDVSVVIDAATKAAAEVKAEQMNIETTHIVRLKSDEPEAPGDHELFSTEAAEALAGKRTDKLIEEVVPPEEPKGVVEQVEAPAPQPQAKPKAKPEPNPVIAAITRPTYAAANAKREATGADVSGMRAFGFVLVVLLGMAAGAYFVLVHEPNQVQADEHEIVFGQDLFSDVINGDLVLGEDPPEVRDAFEGAKNATRPLTSAAGNDEGQFIIIGRPSAEPASAGGDQQPPTPARPHLILQSVVTSHEGRFAVINGKLYKEGSTITGSKLVSVADDWVLMENAGDQFTLQIDAE